eukprot:gene9420-1627_t
MDLDKKPNNRNKGKKMGIRTGNTVKYDYHSKHQTTKPTTYQLQNVKDALNTNEQPSEHSYYCSLGTSITITQSLNKNKAWEVIEETKKDSNYIVDEYAELNQKGSRTANRKPINQQYKSPEESKNQPEEKEQEVETKEVIQTRKGKKTVEKREPGKKGVQKSPKENNEKKETDAEFVVYVHKTQPKNSGKSFQQMVNNHNKDVYGPNKNRKSKKRKEVLNNCHL